MRWMDIDRPTLLEECMETLSSSLSSWSIISCKKENNDCKRNVTKKWMTIRYIKGNKSLLTCSSKTFAHCCAFFLSDCNFFSSSFLILETHAETSETPFALFILSSFILKQQIKQTNYQLNLRQAQPHKDNICTVLFASLLKNQNSTWKSKASSHKLNYCL